MPPCRACRPARCSGSLTCPGAGRSTGVTLAVRNRSPLPAGGTTCTRFSPAEGAAPPLFSSATDAAAAAMRSSNSLID